MRTHSLRVRSAALVCALLAPVLAACGEDPSGKSAEGSKGVIAYVPQTAFAGDTSLAHYKGVQDTVEEAGYEFVVVDPNFDAVEQTNIIENLVAQGDIKGMVVQPIDGQAVVAAIQKANDAGIPVVGNVGEIAEGAETVFSTTMDLAKAGQIPAQAMVDALTEKYGEPRGTVIQIGGPLTDLISQGRLDGMDSVFDQYPDIEVISRPSDWSIEKAETALRDLLTANADADGLISASDFLDDGLVSAMKSTDRYHKAGEDGHLIWTSVDGMPDGLKQVSEGYMEATSDCACEAISVLNVGYLIDHIEGRPLPAVGDSVEESGATWSPGVVFDGTSGPVLRLTAFRIDETTVDTEGLWGSKKYVVEGDRIEYGD